MKILWTESPNVVDKIITAMTGEDCGHMAILFEDVGGTGVIFESNLMGCHLSFFKNWLTKGRTVIHEMTWDLTSEQEDGVFSRIVQLFDGHGYDFFGAIYLGQAKFRKRKFGTPLPLKNKWAKGDKFFCDEIYQIFNGLLGFPELTGQQNSMFSPHDLYLFLVTAAYAANKDLPVPK